MGKGIVATGKLKTTLDEVTAAVMAQSRQVEALNKMFKAQIEATNKVEEANKALEKRAKSLNLELDQSGEIIAKFNKRTAIATKSIKTFRDQGKAFNFGMQTLSEYTRNGGNSLEYLALFLTGTQEELRLMGLEAQNARRIMYGFLPPGMFRVVNKFSVLLNGVGGFFRSLRKGAKDTGDELGTFGKIAQKISTIPMMKFDGKGFLKKTFTEAGRVEESKRRHKNITRLHRDYGKPRTDFTRKEIRTQGKGVKAQAKIVKEMEAKMQFESRLGANLRTISPAMMANERLKLRFDEMGLKLAKKARKENLVRTKVVKAIKRTTKKVGESFLDISKLIGEFAGKALIFMGQAFLLATLLLMAVYVIWKTIGTSVVEALQNMWPAIKEISKIALLGILTIGEGIAMVLGAFGPDGELVDIIEGMVMIAGGLLITALGIVSTIVGGLLLIAMDTAFILFERAKDYVNKIIKKPSEFLKSIPIILAVIGAIAAIIFSAPVWLVAVVFIAVYWLAKRLPMVVNMVSKAIGKAIRKALKPKFPKLDFMAEGGVSAGGLTVVGEKGPELLNLPKNSRVHSNAESRRMVKGSSTVNNFNITVNARDSSKAEMRRMADEIGKMVSSKINRTTSSSNFR